MLSDPYELCEKVSSPEVTATYKATDAYMNIESVQISFSPLASSW